MNGVARSGRRHFSVCRLRASGLNDRGALVILGLDPRIQVSIRRWMVGSSPTMTPERDTDTKL